MGDVIHIEKWLTTHLLRYSRQVAHGDIKSENILVTSWNWVYITDFASYKPVYLPEDDPADYSFYFDTSGRRTCYIAPERFYSSVDSIKQSEGTVTEAMDVFSLGCVLAELFLDGRETFTLSQLFRYRSGELSIQSHLSIIEDENIRVIRESFTINGVLIYFQSLISQMISLNPFERPTFAALLEQASTSAFPSSFYTFLHSYILSVNETASPSPFANGANKNIAQWKVPTLSSSIENDAWATIPSDSDHRIERIWTDFDSIEPILVPQEGNISGRQEAEGIKSEALERTVTLSSPLDPAHDVRVRKLDTLKVGGFVSCLYHGHHAEMSRKTIFPIETYIPNRRVELRTVTGKQAAAEGK